jgi:Fe-S-cluster containining protein
MTFVCRSGCGACCIAPSITSPIPGMPLGKPAGVPCVQLMADYRCGLFGRLERPAFCNSLRPTNEMCGISRDEAMSRLKELEAATAPGTSAFVNIKGAPRGAPFMT